MHGVEKTWADIRVGDFIREARTGVIWKVAAGKEGFWGLQNREGETKILPAPPADAVVTKMFLTEAELEEILERDFGAELHAVWQQGDGAYTCQPFNDLKPRDMISHIIMMHRHHAGVAGSKSARQLIEMHDEMHADPVLSSRWIPHIHSDRFNKEALAWT